ncbi:hypothetical protein GCM10025857_12580 [Alicyclobacillus contaminans]|nr:hypothetical protein GCM10025857_12580 [Alicyclobacillus contaminans]
MALKGDHIDLAFRPLAQRSDIRAPRWGKSPWRRSNHRWDAELSTVRCTDVVNLELKERDEIAVARFRVPWAALWLEIEHTPSDH